MTKLPYIDTIRGVAILMVILVHTGLSVQSLESLPAILVAYCQTGVQLFFVASAFTLCLSSDKRGRERYPLTSFSIRRFFRIAPAYYLGILVYWALKVHPFFSATDTRMGTGPYNTLTVLSNIFFIHGFVPSANNTIVPGGWSIGTEMAFYLLFPPLFLLVRKLFKPTLGFVGIGVAVSVALAVGINSLIYFQTGAQLRNNSFLYFNLFNQFPAFVIGMLYYFYRKHHVSTSSRFANLLGFIALTALSIGVWHLTQHRLTFTLVPAISALSFVFLIEVVKTSPRLNVTWLTRIGQVSYSMYLVHFLFAYQIPESWTLSLTETLGADLALLVLFVGVVVFSFALALLSERLVEKPFIAFGRKLIRKFA